MAAPTFVVADDHPLFPQSTQADGRDGFRQGRDHRSRQSRRGGRTLFSSRRGDIDLVLFDLNMPGVRGFSGLMYIRAQYPEVPVCVISASEEVATIPQHHGARAHPVSFPKSGSADQIKSAIEAILKGDTWLLPDGLDLGSEDDEDTQITRRLSSLTPQQVSGPDDV